VTFPLRNLLYEIGAGILFIKDLGRTAIRTPCRFLDVTDQIWKVTVQSLGTTSMAGFFVGAIMTVQFAVQVKAFGALGFLGGLSTSATIREVGPLLIAFLLSGKVGAFTSAELGTMQVTEQIDAIRCLGANPLQELILPRFIGIVISSFFLLTAGLLMSIFGGMAMAYGFAGINPEEYVRHIPTFVTLYSVVTGLVKCASFAVVLASVCTYKGYTTTGGAKGVGRAVVVTAVATMVGIVFADWFTSFLNDSLLQMYLGD
jgi:phospholipid/cholesterol/gamma-HCH transport system permease protein